MDRVLHCAAAGRSGEWEAVCLDLDLAVQGRSFDEAAKLLCEAIELHYEGVMELPESERRALLYRPVPFRTRLKFAFEAFVTMLRSRSHGDYRHQYTVPAPA